MTISSAEKEYEVGAFHLNEAVEIMLYWFWFNILVIRWMYTSLFINF